MKELLITLLFLYMETTKELKLAVLIDAEIEGHKENSKILISTQRVILGNYDETTIFGPYIVRLNVWR